MSTIERSAARLLPPLVDGERLDQPTFHERYLAMPGDVRAELVNGVVLMMSPLRYHHGDLDSALTHWLQSYRRLTPGLKCATNITITLGPDAEVQPDSILHIREDFGGQARVIDGYLVGPPEMVVEVGHSSRSYDLGPKKELYERFGILEYLFVGAEPGELSWHVRRNGQFTPLMAAEDGKFRSEAFPGLWLDPAALHADDTDALIATLERGLATAEHAAFVIELEARRRDH